MRGASGIDRSALQLAAIAGLPVLSVTHGIDRLRGLWQAVYPAAGRCPILFERLPADTLSAEINCPRRTENRSRPSQGWSEREEARRLGVSRQKLYRARMVAGLSPEAKDEAIRRGLATATTTLLRAAEQGDPAEQVRVIHEEYIRRVRTPGSQLGPRLRAGQ